MAMIAALIEITTGHSVPGVIALMIAVSPADAVRAGADILVIGRPITGAHNPVEAAQIIVEEMAAAD